MVKNLPSNAGDTCSIPGWGPKDPTCHGATKPTCPNKDPVQPKKTGRAFWAEGIISTKRPEAKMDLACSRSQK